MKNIRLAAIVGACALAGAGVRAAVILPADLRELAAGARAIVHGRVVATEPRWVDGRRQIETLVTLHVHEYLKGDLGTEVTFKVPGGQMGPYRSLMIGAPRFEAGDEVVVFLNAQGPTVPWISGLNQGVFRVVTGGAGNKVIVPGVSLAAGEGEDAASIVRGDPTRRRVELQAFTDRVRALVREGRIQ